MSHVIDVSRNQETDEIEQFTIISESGQPELKKATPENILLYDPANELPFEDGMSGFLSGDEALVLQEDEPLVMVAPTTNEYCYILRVKDDTVETTPGQAETVLSGIRDAVVDGNVEPLRSLYSDIMSTQVRRDVMNALRSTFAQDERIGEVADGWLVDDLYLVDWSASMYTKHDDPEEGDMIRGGGGVTQTDRSYEFVQLQLRRDMDPVEVEVAGESFRLTEREMLFLAKVKWLLGRRDYHPDKSFWMFVDKRAAVDWRSGEPDSQSTGEGEDDDDSPDMDSFEL